MAARGRNYVLKKIAVIH